MIVLTYIRRVINTLLTTVAAFAVAGTVGCRSDNVVEITKNIVRDHTIDPYSVADFQSEYEYFQDSLVPLPAQPPMSENPYIQPPIYPNLPQPTDEQLHLLDEHARRVDQPRYVEARGRGFSLPVLDAKGQISNIYPTVEQSRRNVPAPGLQRPNVLGLARVIPNQTYLQLAQQTYAISLISKDSESVSNGSAWLLDYVVDSNGAYPMRWFFATNVHVWLAAQLPLDKGGPYEHLSRTGNHLLDTLRLIHINPRISPLHERMSTTADSSMFDELLIDAEKVRIRTIFMGLDFLYSSPADWTHDPNWVSAQEMADLAIFEVDFTPESLAPIMDKYGYTAEEAMQHFTSRYALLDDNYKVRPLNSQTIINNTLDLPSGNFYALSYPSSMLDPTIDPITENILYSRRSMSRSLWVNRPAELINESLSSKQWARGGNLSASRSYRTFMHRPGIVDMVVLSPNLPSSDPNYPFFDIPMPDGTHRRYMYYGLAYVLDDYAVPGGSSGSPVIDEQFHLVGIHTASDPNASISLVTALNSPGYDYQGYYGSYNMEPYDLLFGNYPNQRHSYRSRLAEIYGADIITDIFPNGPIESTDRP